MTKRGYFGVGIYFPEKKENIGSLFRSAYAFNSNYVFTVGKKYSRVGTDTCNSIEHIPYFNYLNKEEFLRLRPKGSALVVVEISEKAKDLTNFVHPEKAVYLLGSEGGNLPKDIIDNNICVKIPSKICLNVAVAGSIILSHRVMQKGL